MKTSFVLGVLALCLTMIVACEKRSAPQQSEPLQSQSHNETAANAMLGQSEEGAENESSNPSERHEYLDLILQNNTRENIDETAIILGNNRCTFGIVGRGVSAGYLGWERPVGTNAVVKWRVSAKINREARVDISSAYVREVPGQLTFTIAGTNVTVDFQRLNRK
jgi:hypothetical protein